jgi:carbonic anhydrase
MNHPWIPTEGPDASTVRGFIYDVDTGGLEEVSYPGPMGTFGKCSVHAPNHLIS